ncbi:Hypothetical_protein [Hexamita inflata]|uniref:Hypothetical_protein n=1 Tax=Hexamita inflata TaxID=28002 RepID=A0AA86RKB3_9EUKA|nr:Hypothetical protein HINF_LOCUS64093 [Hexamita inflata]
MNKGSKAKNRTLSYLITYVSTVSIVAALVVQNESATSKSTFWKILNLVLVAQLCTQIHSCSWAASLLVVTEQILVILSKSTSARATLVAASCAAFGSTVLSQQHQLAKSAHSAAGATLMFLSSLEQPSLENTTVCFLLVSVYSLVFNDIASPVVAIVFFGTADASNPMKVYGAAFACLLLGVNAFGLFRHSAQKLRAQQSKYRRLQSHAVMNAYVTME